ncbi:N-acetylneuraminate synthase [Paenibacillus sp. NEAU-GSW1]|uniref:N-acetylneuraminate synthase n=1 Tax=Paenibacillus sp. NEAU-GSW1 TaxID=2682486 RepID=UPI0012E25C2A|nr:N-acetylneuraminate synthase [Paenibacillus sp. NEAU-GSW1]MUT65005.1 N-acetylneuraminate synthase [Paenibacillus sp. NEAU-GSW1]
MAYIIAEAGVNHNGSLDFALTMIREAAAAGADAIKFQTFKADQLVSKHAAKADYQKQTTDAAESQLDMIRKLELSSEEHAVIIEECRRVGITFMSTPFDLPSLQLLTGTYKLQTLKISSGDITNLPLLYCAGRSGADVILSTGICTLGEIEEALGALAFAYIDQDDVPSVESFRAAYFSDAGQDALRRHVTLLHCTTDYPTASEDVHLNKMVTIRQAFGLRTGYSDHTIGTEISVAAVALGAVVIEKHFTLDKSMEGPDHKASMEPEELALMVRQIRNVERAMGIAVKIPAASELRNATAARKSVVAARSITAGETFTEANLTLKRPGNGLPPSAYWKLLGQTADRAYEPDDLIR